MRQINTFFWNELTKRVATERATRIEQMAKGRFRVNHEGYTEAVGFINGLDWFLQEAVTIMKSDEEEENAEGA